MGQKKISLLPQPHLGIPCRPLLPSHERLWTFLLRLLKHITLILFCKGLVSVYATRYCAQAQVTLIDAISRIISLIAGLLLEDLHRIIWYGEHVIAQSVLEFSHDFTGIISYSVTSNNLKWTLKLHRSINQALVGCIKMVFHTAVVMNSEHTRIRTLCP